MRSHTLLHTRPGTAYGCASAGTVRGVARRTKIIATIGPASADEATLISMMQAGMNVARIALAHTPLDEALERHQRIRNVAERLGLNIGTMIDLPGSKSRTGRFPAEGVEFSVDDTVTLVPGTGDSTAEEISIDYAHLVTVVD